MLGSNHIPADLGIPLHGHGAEMKPARNPRHDSTLKSKRVKTWV
jgi:hypothetical protein